MVKVVEKGLEHITKDEKLHECREITAKMVGEENIKDMSDYYFNIYKGDIKVSLIMNKVDVFKEEYFPLALQLAKAYETIIDTEGGEFTLNKRYE